MNTLINQPSIELSFYIKKFLIPLWEKKWLLVGISCLGVVLSFFVSSFIESEYFSSATLFIEKPSTEMTRVKREEMEPETASEPYVQSQAEKLRSTSMASEVLNILPQDAKSDLLSATATKSQLLEGFLNIIGQILGKDLQNKISNILGFKSEDMSQREVRFRRQNELKSRLTVTSQSRSSLIKITASSFAQDVAPRIIQSYLDIYLANNLEENKESVRAKRQFIAKQREEAEQAYQKAKQAMIDYRKSYGIPGDFEKARDIEIQLQLNSLESEVQIAKERFQHMDSMFMDLQEREAGITNNVKVLEQPTVPTSASRGKIKKLRDLIILAGFALGIAIILGLDFLKAPLRHEKDVHSAVQVPILGYLPQIKK